VNPPRPSVPSPLGAQKSKAFFQLPRTTGPFSSTTTLLPYPSPLVVVRKHLTSRAKTRRLLTRDHGGALKRLDMGSEDKERKKPLFEDLSSRSLLSPCPGTCHHPLVRSTRLATIPVYPLLPASTLLITRMMSISRMVSIMKGQRHPHLLSGRAPLLFKCGSRSFTR